MTVLFLLQMMNEIMHARTMTMTVAAPIYSMEICIGRSLSCLWAGVALTSFDIADW